MSTELCWDISTILHPASPWGQGPGDILVMKTQFCSNLGVQQARRVSHGAHPTGAPPVWCLALEEADELQGLSRTTHCASGHGRTCRAGGHPGGSTRSLSAPATGVSCSSGDKRGKRSHLLWIPVLCYIPFSPQNPPAF